MTTRYASIRSTKPNEWEVWVLREENSFWGGRRKFWAAFVVWVTEDTTHRYFFPTREHAEGYIRQLEARDAAIAALPKE